MKRFEMKEDRILHRVWCTFMSMLVMVCLCGLTFTACVDDESIVDPIYAVDLGLSVKWAWCNVGAERPEQEGNLYAWGETQVKSDYSPSNYEHNAEYTYIGTDICGTAYDAAQVAMGEGWRMPTREEIMELVSRCTWEKAYLKGCNGVFVTGPNGNKIFLPNVSKGYWSGALASMDNNYPERSHSLSWAHSLPWLNGKDVSFKLSESYCYTGLAIRPVKTSDMVYNDGIESITITTGEATNITSEGATLSGIVSGATNEISCGIIYGTASNITSLNNKRVGAYYNGAYSIDVSYLQPGTTYYYCAYAVIGGEELFGEVREFTTNILIDGFEAVDLGLSVKWATHNVGAEFPEDYGDYFAWGETTTKSEYTESNSLTYRLSYEELVSRGIIGSNGNLTAEYDAATANWGDAWRMPTSDEIFELFHNCTLKWISMNSVNGLKATGPNDNSIFLPASQGYGYWSATPYVSGYAYCLYYFDGHFYINSPNNRFDGIAVRPVSE